MGRNILITNYEISQYSGSEINAATIAKRFKEKGYKVYMAALFLGGPLYDQVKEYFDEVIDVKQNNFDFSNIEFDIVWAHHSFLLNWLIFENKIKAKKVIISSLSAKELFEAIPDYSNDLSLILANSEETKEKLEEEGLKEVKLLENYSFKSYFERNIKVEKLQNIAIVSNHVPEELHEAKKKLIDTGYNVTIYGVEGKRELITDKILEKYDAIITIGKTVQYAMSLKIPVYVYDIFGGEGYLTLENLEKNRKRNFSGRGFEQKTSDQIYDEIIQNFDKTLGITEDIKKYALERFCFENKIDEVLQELESKPELDLEQVRKKYKNEERLLLVPRQMYRALKVKHDEDVNRREEEFLLLANKLKNEIKQKDDLLNKKQEEIESGKQELQAIKNSKTWRYANSIKKFIK